MSEFEYISVLLSIIFGLGISKLLGGIGVMIHRRRQGQLDLVHGLWVWNIFFLLAANWWVTFRFQIALNAWNFELFFTLLVWATFLYLPSILLFPPYMGRDQNFGEIYERNRRWLMGSMLGFIAMEIVQTAFRGELFTPWYYLPFVLHMGAIFLLALLFERRSVQRFCAIWVAVVLPTWMVLVRRLIDGVGPVPS